MIEVNEGDRIFHYVKGNIVAISVAKTECQIASRPSTMQILITGMIMAI